MIFKYGNLTPLSTTNYIIYEYYSFYAYFPTWNPCNAQSLSDSILPILIIHSSQSMLKLDEITVTKFLVTLVGVKSRNGISQPYPIVNSCRPIWPGHQTTALDFSACRNRAVSPQVENCCLRNHVVMKHHPVCNVMCCNRLQASHRRQAVVCVSKVGNYLFNRHRLSVWQNGMLT